MKNKQNFLLYYIIFFYSFCIAAIICFIALSILNLKPGSMGNLDDVLPSLHPNFLPKTYRFINYLLSIFLITFTTLVLYFWFTKLARQYPHILGKLLPLTSILTMALLPLSFVITVFAGIDNLEQYEFIFRLNPVIYSPFHILLFLLGIVVIGYLYFFYDRIKKASANPLIKKLIKFISIFSLFLIVITLFDRTFEERDLFIYRIQQYIHTIPIIAPINDVLAGKVILVNANSQYGTLLPYLLAPVFKFIPLTFTNFFYLMIVLGIFYYIAGFILLNLRLKSRLWALIGLICLFTFHFYSTFDRYTRPMVFPLRYIFDLGFFIILLGSNLSQKKWSFFLLPLYLGVAFFYNYESGFSLIIAYLVFIYLKMLDFRHSGNPPVGGAPRIDPGQARTDGFWTRRVPYGNPSNQNDKKHVGSKTIIGKEIALKLISFASNVLPVVIWIFTFGLLYSFYALMATGQFPDWPHALFYIKIFTRGSSSGTDPLPLIGFHLLPLTIYLIVIIKSLIIILGRSYAVRHCEERSDKAISMIEIATPHFRSARNDKVNHILLRNFYLKNKGEKNTYWDATLAVYGLLILVYFIKSSYILNLTTVSLPAIILGIVLFKELFAVTVANRGYLKSNISLVTLFIPYIVFSSLVVFGASFFVARLTVNHKQEYWAAKADRVEWAKLYYQLMLSTKAFEKHEKGKRQVALLSYYDGFINLYAGRVNILRLTNSQLILTIRQVESLLAELKSNNPQYIYTDSDSLFIGNTYSYMKKSIFPLLFEYLYQNYQKIDTIGVLDVWQKKDRLLL